jgi:hypothetical protein
VASKIACRATSLRGRPRVRGAGSEGLVIATLPNLWGDDPRHTVYTILDMAPRRELKAPFELRLKPL